MLSRSYSLCDAPQKVHLPLCQVCSIRLKRILPWSFLNASQIEYLPFAVLEQYTLRRDSSAVNSVMAMPNNWFWKIWLMRCCLSGIWGSKPAIKRLAISHRNTPDLQTGSRNVAFLSRQSSSGKLSKIWLAKLGGVNTSSLLRLARQVNTSGL